MGIVMGVMLGLVLIGVLGWGGGHGMMGGHQGGHMEEAVKKEPKDLCQQPDCDPEKLKEKANSENGEQTR